MRARRSPRWPARAPRSRPGRRRSADPHRGPGELAVDRVSARGHRATPPTPSSDCAARRRPSRATLLAALAALERGDLGRGRGARCGGAGRARPSSAAWEVGVITLPVWVETADAMIGAMERLVAATRDGDAAACDGRGRRVRRARRRCGRRRSRPAHRARRGGQRGHRPPLERLAALLGGDRRRPRLATAAIAAAQPIGERRQGADRAPDP